jgi:hypothetical protein
VVGVPTVSLVAASMLVMLGLWVAVMIFVGLHASAPP